jgi:hypothetical protein
MVGQIEIDVFKTSIRTSGDFCGVFECNNETSYFYLYALRNAEESKIVGATQLPRQFDLKHQAQYDVRWNAAEDAVGVFLDDALLAVFNITAYAKSNSVYRALIGIELKDIKFS